MSHSVEINNTIMEMLLVTEAELKANDPSVLLLYQFLQNWQETGLISEITMTQDGGDPNLYAYRVERKDTTTFDQTLLFTAVDDIDPIVTVDLDPGWRLSVLAYEPPIRKQIIEIRSCCDLLSFNVEFA